MTDKEKSGLIVSLRKELHDNPEKSMNEVETRRILMQFIREHTQTLKVVDRTTWFYAVKEGRQTGSPIAFRADYDAVTCADGCTRHLCGHDGHSAVLAGLALWLDSETVDRDVYLIFQPGEENGKGAYICSSIIEEKQIGEIYGFHNIPGYECGEVILLNNTFACASTGLEIQITGKQTHAAYPENGVNPADVIAGIIQSMNEYICAKHKGIALGTVIGIEAGSRSYGVAASDATMRLTVRAEYQDEYNAFVSYIEAKAEQLAAEIGAEIEISRIEEFPATINDAECVRKIQTAAYGLNRKVVYPEEPFRWSEDFGYYLQKTRGAYMGIGCGTDHPGLHTDDYEFDDTIIAPVIELYSKLI